jgi:soluble lytic murein transglycosylase-like protein
VSKYKNEDTYAALISKASAKYGIPTWVIYATIGQESSFNPKASLPEPRIGDRSRGLMQVLEKTARSLGYHGIVGDDKTGTGGLYDPEINILLGTKLLSEIRQERGDVPWDEVYDTFNQGGAASGGPKDSYNDANVLKWIRVARYFESKFGLSIADVNWDKAYPPAPEPPAGGAPPTTDTAPDVLEAGILPEGRGLIVAGAVAAILVLFFKMKRG